MPLYYTTRQNEKPSRASVFVHLAQGLIGILSGEQTPDKAVLL